jgi:chaperonin GroES
VQRTSSKNIFFRLPLETTAPCSIWLPSAVFTAANPREKRQEVFMNIRPLHDRLIVKREAEERKSPGGIVIPDTATEKPLFGKVLAVGKGKLLDNGQLRAPDIKVGDKILFGKYSGTEVKVNGDELVVMREEDVMAVVE